MINWRNNSTGAKRIKSIETLEDSTNDISGGEESEHPGMKEKNKGCSMKET